MDEQQTCRWCGTVLRINPRTTPGRQQFCSSVCRVNAHRFHKRYPQATVWGKQLKPETL